MAPKAKRGSGGGNRNGGNNDDDDGDEGAGDLFSDEQRTELGNLINAAVSGQLSRKLPSAIKGALDDGLAPIKELLERGAGKQRAAGGDDEDDDDDEDQRPARGQRGRQRNADEQDQRGTGRKDPKMSKLEQEVAKMRTEREAERVQTRNRERDAMLREELTKAGVDPNRMRGAVKVVQDSLVYDDKNDEWTYRTKRDGIDEDLDVSAGVSEWAGTDEGKSYLGAAKGTQQEQRRGAGTRVQTQTRAAGGGVINRGNATQDAKTAKVQAKQEAYKNLAGAINELGGATIGIG